MTSQVKDARSRTTGTYIDTNDKLIFSRRVIGLKNNIHSNFSLLNS